VGVWDVGVWDVGVWDVGVWDVGVGCGMWCGSVGVWGCGMWECGSVGVWQKCVFSVRLPDDVHASVHARLIFQVAIVGGFCFYIS
jgi:hypothetical protein